MSVENEVAVCVLWTDCLLLYMGLHQILFGVQIEDALRDEIQI